MSFTTEGRPPPPSINESLYGEIPRISSTNAIQWYQYLKCGDYLTYPAELCWDMEGHWFLFQEQYAINPAEAEANHSRFSLNEYTIVDILNMKVTYKDTGVQYELKRTNNLIGTLSDYGHITFNNGDLWNATFVYDRKTGYDEAISENEIHIGDKVIFEAFWNKNDNDIFVYGATHKMLAFNVNALSYCNDALPAPEFSARRIEGLILSLKNDIGLIVCFPYANRPQQPLTLLYQQPLTTLSVNTCVQCSIGINPLTNADCIFRFVAMDVVISQYNAFDESLLPITIPLIKRKYKGSVNAFVENKKWGFIYNEFDNNMCTLPSDENKCNYRLGMNVRYNERTNDTGLGRNGYIATDVVVVERTNKEIVNTYYAKNGQLEYKAKEYILDCELAKKNMNVVFTYIQSTVYDTDIHLLVQESEMYINAFLNTMNGAGVILFGVHANGRILGQKCMNKAKREYIERAINKRLNYFTPKVPSEYVSVQYKQVIDKEGYALIDTYVIMVGISMVYDTVHNIQFITSMNKMYEMKDNKLRNTNRKQLEKHKINYQHNKLSPQFLFGTVSISSIEYKDNDDEHKEITISAHKENNLNETDDYIPQYTTPELNALQLPPNTEQGREELAIRVQTKLNEMMKISEYALDPQWQGILTLAESHLYNAQKTVWNTMKNLETEKIKAFPKKQNEVRKQQNTENASTAIVNIDGVIPVISDNIDIVNNESLPVLPDKSKYKVVAKEYCQKMGWIRPKECIAMDLSGYRATVSFGKPGHETTASGVGTNKKIAAYQAYMKLIPMVIPTNDAMDLMSKWIPGYTGYNKKETVGQMPVKHPKNRLLEWADKHGMAKPKRSFSPCIDSTGNMRSWIARVTFGGKTVEAKGPNKKDAESHCCYELLTFVMKKDIVSSP